MLDFHLHDPCISSQCNADLEANLVQGYVVIFRFRRNFFLFLLTFIFHILYTGCHRRNGPNFRRVFLMLNSTDITQNTYIQSWTVREIMSIEKCGLLCCPRTVRRPWRHIHPLRKPGNDKPLANIGMQWRWRDNAQLLLASITWKPKTNATALRVFL